MQTLNASVSVTTVQCTTCANMLEPSARFCGFCGALTPAQGAAPAPQFAMVAPLQAPTISNELQDEACKLLMQLARERLLLLFHWCLFVGMNLFGVWTAMKCYNEF